MLRKIAPFLALFVLVLKTNAQPQPCGPNPAMTPTCLEACVICDIDGYTGINDNLATGVAPPGFCTSTVHHIQWLAFIAGSTSLTIELQVFNCQNGGGFNGLEVGIYESLDCQTFNLVTNCDGDVNNNTTGVFTTTEPLTIGQYYYWVMDGNAGDVCNYTINVTEGSTLVPPLPPAGAVTGEAEPCINQTYAYTVPQIVGANFYKWTLDGQPIGGNTTIDVTWTTPGQHQLCVTAFNVCDTVAPSCFFVNVAPPIETTLMQGICEGDCFEVADTMVCDAGNYEFHVPSWLGCDSAIFLQVSITPSVSSNLSATICETDSIAVAGQYFYPPGQFQAVDISWLGCDSLINVTLNAVVCEIQGATVATSLICHGDLSGSIVFSVVNGTPPFTYSWKELNGSPSGNGNLANINTDETLSGLPPGTYIITIQDGFGNDVVLIATLTQPDELALDWLVSEYNGLNISCFGKSDGTLEALVTGGTAPYTYTWGNGASTALLENLPAGTYQVTVTDAAGCSLAAQNTLVQSTELLLAAQSVDPSCEGFNTGNISVGNVSGGQPPYVFDLNGGGFGQNQTFEALPGGSYTLTAKDENNCTVSTAVSLAVPGIPLIDAGDDMTIKLGESAYLKVFSNLLPTAIVWSPTLGLPCPTCQNPEATPFVTTTYYVTVTSADGCIAADSITVNVLTVRDLYVPNAFSPNGDGLNDALTVFAGAAVSEVRSLRVFDRWGELVFENTNFAPNDLGAGWDGTFRGKRMQPGVFAWFADVVFLDGGEVLAKGDVTLVK